MGGLPSAAPERPFQLMTPSAWSASISSVVIPRSLASTSSVCSPSHGGRRSGPSATLDSLMGLPGYQDGLLDVVGSRQLDEHVAGGHVGILDHLLVAEARTRGQAGAAQVEAGLDLGPSRRPAFDGGADVAFEIVEPELAGGEARDR